MQERYYLCIDLKSFYASVECAERNLDAMTTNLVVADPERGSGTICLAVSPSMKALGVRNRCRVFEIPSGINYIMAPPRMQLYINYSAEIYSIYLKYVAKEDIHVYSIDEAFLDITNYLNLYSMNPKELGSTIMEDIKNSLGITATCGIGTNLYLTKIALDITAKHAKDRIGFLDEESYCQKLWNHRPITDFWRIGPGIARRLARYGIVTMGDIAHTDKALLFKTFGIDSEILFDHAWGREPVTIEEIKNYHSKSHSISSGQVLLRDYSFSEGLLIVQEMVDLICLDLIDKHLVTRSLTLYVGYSKETQKGVKGTAKLSVITNLPSIISKPMEELYSGIVDRNTAIRRVMIACNDVIDEAYEQYDFFTDYQAVEEEKSMQQALLQIKEKYGKNAILKGMNFEEAGTTIERNMQIGGHKDGVSR